MVNNRISFIEFMIHMAFKSIIFLNVMKKMCDCQEKKLCSTGLNVAVQRENTIACHQHNYFPNQSFVRDFKCEKCVMIHWDPCHKEIFVPFSHYNDGPNRNISQSSLYDTSSQFSITDKFVNDDNVAYDRDNDEGECQDGNEYNNCDMSEDKFKIVPKQLDQTSGIDKDKKPDIECTLALINPDTVKHQMFIEQIIINEGFEICHKKILRLSPEQTAKFFDDKHRDTSFPHMISYMSSGPIVALLLAKHRAINDWKKLMGPEEIAKAKLYFPDSIRAIFGKDKPFENAVHGSSSYTAAQREIRYFFPDFISEPIMTGKKVEKYIWDIISPTLKKGIILCCRKKPNDPLKWLADWLLENNPNQPQIIFPFSSISNREE